tara:strand:- start:478 stop:729 length:252 start_codon:yes stop_codon:yes gene_type:complete
MKLTLLTRKGCHLCDDMKNLILNLKKYKGVEFEEIDISGNIKLIQLWDTEIPVLLLGEKIIARHRIGRDNLEKELTAALADEV